MRRGHRPEPPARTRTAGAPGFSLLEMIVVLGIVGILAAAMVPLVFGARERDRTRATREKLTAIKEGILGARRTPPGASEPSFGFLGDLGRLPARLERLVNPDGLSAYAVDPATGLGVGWRGPYVSPRVAGDSAGIGVDAFGRGLEYSTASTTVDGVEWAGWIRSAGPDGRFAPSPGSSADDIVAPLLEGEVRAALHGFLVAGSGRVFVNAPLEFVHREDGGLQTTVLQTDGSGRARLTDVEMGSALIRAAPAGGQQTGFLLGSAAVTGNKFEDVEFTIGNVSREPVALTSITVFLPASLDDRCYRELFINGEEIFPAGGGSTIRCDGETLTFDSPVHLSAGSASVGATSRRTVVVDRPVVLAPPIRIGSETDDGVGDARVILGDWRDGNGTGAKVDMRGVELTVQFSDGLTFTFTTPS